MRNHQPKLIVMLTYNDHTIKDAAEIFEQCKDCEVEYWGFKEEGLPLPEMKALFSQMKECGKTTILEVVAYSEEESLKGAEMAAECGCDILMGTSFYDSVHSFCKENNLKYMPFIGKVSERPSILQGSIEEMIEEAKSHLKKGVFGFDLLGYRYEGDATLLIRRFIQEIDAPICVAGSINSLQRIDEIKEASPWAFTIGGAFFDHRFGESIEEQIEEVLHHIQKEIAYA